VQIWQIVLDPASDPKRMLIESRPDFDGDGKPDVALTRNCLYRLEEDGKKLLFVYGSSRTNAQLDLASGPPAIKKITSDPGMPTELAPSGEGDLVTLVRIPAP
jgi:hypothetical protein